MGRAGHRAAELGIDPPRARQRSRRINCQAPWAGEFRPGRTRPTTGSTHGSETAAGRSRPAAAPVDPGCGSPSRATIGTGPDGYRLVPDSESIAVINSFNRESFARMTAPSPCVNGLGRKPSIPANGIRRHHRALERAPAKSSRQPFRFCH